MSIVFSTVKTSLYNWVVANLPGGMPAIYLYSNSPRPTIDYVTLYISSVSQIAWDYVQEPTTTSGIANQIGDREFTFQIQAYGGDPLTILNNLRSSLQKETVLDSLRANGIVLANWFDIVDLTTLIDTRYELRASLDIRFRMSDQYTDNHGVISTVSLEEQVLNPSGSIIFDKTFLIPPPP